MIRVREGEREGTIKWTNRLPNGATIHTGLSTSHTLCNDSDDDELNRVVLADASATAVVSWLAE